MAKRPSQGLLEKHFDPKEGLKTVQSKGTRHSPFPFAKAAHENYSDLISKLEVENITNHDFELVITPREGLWPVLHEQSKKLLVKYSTPRNAVSGTVEVDSDAMIDCSVLNAGAVRCSIEVFS